MVHQIAPSAFKMKKGGAHIFQLSLICTLKAIEVIKKVKKGKKRLGDWAKAFKHTVVSSVSLSLVRALTIIFEMLEDFDF